MADITEETYADIISDIITFITPYITDIFPATIDISLESFQSLFPESYENIILIFSDSRFRCG